MTLSIRISRFIALLGSAFTIVQVFLLLIGDQGICFNDGCHIVDSMTSIPPIWFNVGGFAFFQIIYWGLKYVSKEGWYLGLLRLFLLGAVSAEGVLVSFQYFVADVFCSYCLIIFAHIVLLNLLAGTRQIFSGIAAFAAVVLAFTTLQFGVMQNNLFDSLHIGSFGATPGRSEETRYLFFSSECRHCEELLAYLNGAGFAVSFNPIDEIEDVPLPEVRKNVKYDYEVNRALLQTLGIKKVPVLMINSESEYKIIIGSDEIERYFQSCLNTSAGSKQSESSSVSSEGDTGYGASSQISHGANTGLDFLTPGKKKDDACSILENCQ